MAFEIKIVKGSTSRILHPQTITIRDVWPNSPAGRWYLSMLTMTEEQVKEAVEREEIGEAPGTYIELCGLNKALFPTGSIEVHIPTDADAIYSLRENGDTKDKWPSAAMRAQLEMVQAGWRPGDPIPPEVASANSETRVEAQVESVTG